MRYVALSNVIADAAAAEGGNPSQRRSGALSCWEKWKTGKNDLRVLHLEGLNSPFEVRASRSVVPACQAERSATGKQESLLILVR